MNLRRVKRGNTCRRCWRLAVQFEQGREDLRFALNRADLRATLSLALKFRELPQRIFETVNQLLDSLAFLLRRVSRDRTGLGLKGRPGHRQRHGLTDAEHQPGGGDDGGGGEMVRAIRHDSIL